MPLREVICSSCTTVVVVVVVVVGGGGGGPRCFVYSAVFAVRVLSILQFLRINFAVLHFLVCLFFPSTWLLRRSIACLCVFDFVALMLRFCVRVLYICVVICCFVVR